MKRLLTGLALLVCSLGAAAQHCIPSGTTDQYTYFVAVDATDLVTRETGLTSFTVYRSRNGGAAAAFDSPTVNEVDATHMPGVYELLLDEDMTIGAGNDVEHMVLHISHAGMAPVTKEICIARAKLTEGETLTVSSGVASANATQWGGTAVASATVNANVAQISGDSGAADALEAAFDGTAGAVAPLGIARQGTAQSATETTLVLDASASFGDDVPIGMTLVACGSTQGYCQSRVVTDYTGSTDTATVEAWEVTPSGTITYYLFATAPGSSGGGEGASAEEIAEEVWTYTGTGGRQLTALDEDNTTIDLNGTTIGTVGAIGTGGITSTSFAAGAITATAIAADAITNSELASTAIAEIQSGLATAADLATVDANVDAIKVVTDKLDDTLEEDSGAYRFTAAALAEAPIGEGISLEGIAAEVWEYALDDCDGEAGSVCEAVAGMETAAQTGAAAALADYDPPTKSELDAAIGGLNDLDGEAVETAVGNALTSYGASTFDPATDKVDVGKVAGVDVCAPGDGGGVVGACSGD